MASLSPLILPLNQPVGPRDHLTGPADGRLVLVEYGDYQCPQCKFASTVVEEILATLGDSLTFVFRHFPLVRVHPDAFRAAQAAEAASAQGKFWEMHRALFSHDLLDAESLAKYAGEIGLDAGRFQTELAAGKYMQRVQEDIAGAMKSGVSGTPTFFINGKKHVGSFKLDALLEALRAGQG